MKKRLTREEYHKGLIGKVPKKYHKEMLEEFDKYEEFIEEYDEAFDRDEELNKVKEPEEIHKRFHEINTFQCVDNELYLRGKDEMGNDFTLCFDAFNFLEWIDKEQIDYIKEKVIEYVEKK